MWPSQEVEQFFLSNNENFNNLAVKISGVYLECDEIKNTLGDDNEL